MAAAKQPAAAVLARQLETLSQKVETKNEAPRDAFEPPFELSLVEETQSRRQKGDDCRRTMNFQRKGRRSTRLIVILQEARQPVLEVQTRQKVPAHRRDMPLH